MATDNLTEADFEPISVDANGDFNFSPALLKLRRSVVGLHNKIFPVFLLNTVPNGVLVDYQSNTTKNQFVIYTTDATLRTFVTSIQGTWTSDAAATNTEMNVKANPVSRPLVYRVWQMVKQTTTAHQDTFTQYFNPPLELQKNSSVLFTNIFGAGASNAQVTIFGYTQP